VGKRKGKASAQTTEDPRRNWCFKRQIKMGKKIGNNKSVVRANEERNLRVKIIKT